MEYTSTPGESAQLTFKGTGMELFPAIFLAITCICINIVGDTLRDVMDPKSDRDK